MLDQLPPHLGERTRVIREVSAAAAQQGELVVYWMRNAVRLEENPALDVACWLAHRLDLPLLIYHAISEHYPYASDRHHTFMLEGAMDVQARAESRGFAYAFHLATPADRRPHLIELARRAAAVVTEDMPVDPPRHFLRRLSERSTTPLIAVDTACVVPMQVVGRPYTRAYQFREATKKLYKERLHRPWPESVIPVKTYPLTRLPFTPLKVTCDAIGDLVAACEIDHAVGPVLDTGGGSTAGYQRWHDFFERGIRQYANDRNHPLRDAVSRLSPYLHYGMVSPLRIAREAAALKHPGAEKFLDELLIWRELAYAFCFYRADHDQWTALPDWAQGTLTEHANDPRPALLDWETLARGQSGDPLWDAAQHSLLAHGELHNNVRMTWGKAILNWTASPFEALATIIDLNHRYALDGRDPASYGGILWCLGQFDRPFSPELPILGTVRPRPTDEHARRLPPERYLQHLLRRIESRLLRVAVIGAGLSGMMAARTLVDNGHAVTVFEKSRGVGGRMATRRLEDGISVDHGAQYFTVRDPRLQRYARAWLAQGLIAPWPNRRRGDSQRIAMLNRGVQGFVDDGQERFVGVPSMNAVCKHLARGLTVQTETRIVALDASSDGWSLSDEQGNSFGPFDYLILSCPAEQTADLLQGRSPLSEQARRVTMEPCWAAMWMLPRPLATDWVAAFVSDSPLSWIARNSTKPGRVDGRELIVAHANPGWTRQHWDQDATTVVNELLRELWIATGAEPHEPSLALGHRWKYALASEGNSAGAWFDRDQRIVVCGDWVAGSRVEGAFLSGMAAAGRVLGSIPKIESSKPRQLTMFS